MLPLEGQALGQRMAQADLRGSPEELYLARSALGLGLPGPSPAGDGREGEVFTPRPGAVTDAAWLKSQVIGPVAPSRSLQGRQRYRVFGG